MEENLKKAWQDVVAGLVVAVVAVVITGGAILNNPYFLAAVGFTALVVLLLALGERHTPHHR